MNLQTIITMALAIAGFGSAWSIQGLRMDAKVNGLITEQLKKDNDHAEQQRIDDRAAATAAIRRTETVIAAQSAAMVRATTLRRDAVGTRTALVGLSDASERELRNAAASQTACIERANTLSQLLNTVATAGGELAEKAGRHTSDIQTLTESWPTDQTHK